MENAVEIVNLGKMYRLFDKQSDRIQDIFGLDKLRFWDREPRYREFWALRNINLTVPKGERIGIIGRNGAGKSTLLKLIVGNLRPTEGSIHVNGKIQALLQIGTGFHPEFTGIENIRTALAYAGMDSKKIKSCMDEIIEFSELEDYIHQPVKYYSAGMYSRLAFAVSTSLEPDILIIDEVLGAGDAAFTSKCAERMKHLTQDTGATVLFVSHSMESVLEICNRAILLERGEITHQGTALEVSKIYNKKIRYEEELRARAKEFRISRKSMLNIAQADEATQVLVMRLVCDTPHPHYKHLIYGGELSADGEPVSQLHFGAPMDDDPAQFTRVIADKGGMDWSDAKKDRGNFYRAYCDQGGSNCHAPFQMEIPFPSGHRGGPAHRVCLRTCRGGGAAPSVGDRAPLRSRRPERGTGPGKRGALGWGPGCYGLPADATDQLGLRLPGAAHRSPGHPGRDGEERPLLHHRRHPAVSDPAGSAQSGPPLCGGSLHHDPKRKDRDTAVLHQ